MPMNISVEWLYQLIGELVVENRAFRETLKVKEAVPEIPAPAPLALVKQQKEADEA